MTANGVRLMLERRTRAAGITLSAHAFRRGFAVEAIRSGVSQVSVERLGGWAPGSPMVTNYSRTRGEDLAIDEFRRHLG